MSAPTCASPGSRLRGLANRSPGAATAIAWMVLLCGIASGAAAQPGTPDTTPEFEVLHVQGNVYMLAGPGGNVALQVGDDGILVVDSMGIGTGEQLLGLIREISEQPIRFLINTHAHPDHVGGNTLIARAGSSIAGGNIGRTIADVYESARIIAHENVLVAMSTSDDPVPFEAWPTDTYFTDLKDLYFNGEALQILHQPAAHTDGDSIVFFRRSDVIATGDIFLTTSYPYIDRDAGGSFQGIIDALNRILRLTVPADRQEGGTMIIPGHGRLCDEADLVEYRDMLTIIRDRIRYFVEQEMSLEEVRDAHPTLDYDGRYGTNSGTWTTDRFVEAIYEELRQSVTDDS